jgi:putative transposase
VQHARQGNYYDNAVAVSFFNTLKVEVIHGQHFPTRAVMQQTVSTNHHL